MSDADLAVDALVRSRLPRGWAILSEEGADDPDRLRCTHVLIVDPIDGTRAYLRGEPHYAVALALLIDGVLTAAVVAAPALGVTWSAGRGTGAWREAGGAPAQIAATGSRLDRIAASAHSFARLRLSAERVARPSLALRMCLAADGTADAMAALTPVWDWDVASGALIAAEAGATVTTAAGAAPVWNTPAAAQKGLLAAPPALHPKLLRAA